MKGGERNGEGVKMEQKRERTLKGKEKKEREKGGQGE